MTAFRLGLTGSIGMGKSTTAAMFAASGCGVWGADDAVHRLYAPGGAAVDPLADMFPQALENMGISRDALKKIIAQDPTSLSLIEGIVHPLVAADRMAFVQFATQDIVILDIPLLFENGAEADMDATLLVTAPQDVQRARVLARPGMTEDLFTTILSRQMPDAEKRARATHVVETLSVDQVAAYVTALLVYLRKGLV